MASLEFASANAPPQHSLYGQPDMDPSYNLPGSESVGAFSHMRPNVGANSKQPAYRQSSLDAADHPANYELYNNPNGQGAPPFSSQRYRTNGSSSSSMGHNFALNSEGMYPQSSFGESVPSFGGSNGYDMMNNGSYSGKASPLTPSDPSLQHGGPFPPSANSHYHDVPDRRLSMNSNGYHPTEYPDEYSMNGMNNGIPFGQSVPQFSERLGRYPPDRYPHPQAQQPMPPHLSSQNEMMGGIPPHATHSYDRERGYDNMQQHYMNPTPHSDMSLRMASTVDETLARMKLQAPPMGGSNDLQTFIR
jgi:recombining binding protein suppressor of hairless